MCFSILKVESGRRGGSQIEQVDRPHFKISNV